MKKQLIILGITFLLLAVVFSGCQDNKTDNGSKILGDTDKVELVMYSIETYDKTHEKIGDGFVHDSKANYYKITGTVKNIAGRYLDRVYTGARFYDNNNNYLNKKVFSTPDLVINSKANFTMTYPSSDEYFGKVESVKFYLFVITD